MSIKHIPNTSSRLAIIGAGPSGLALGLFLNTSPDILEARDHVGGHASSFMAEGFTFDYGPHILFSRDQKILDFIVASLSDNVSRCRRNNKVSYQRRIMKYPFENDLKSLDPDDNYDCISGFIFNPYKEKYVVPTNMKEWFLKTFGEGICSRYLFPYNEKIWNIPVEQLSMSLADRIPNPKPEDILKSSLGYSTEGYLHQLYYFYPKTGGYQAISEVWKRPLSINYRFKVERIEFLEGKIHLFDEQANSRVYDQVVSTMPVHEMISIMDVEIPDEIQEAVQQLIVNPMFVISFGVVGTDPNQYTAVYFPEAEFWVNRISYPCTFSRANGPEGHWSLQAEITCARDSALWQQSNGEILDHTKRGLQQRGLLPNNAQIVFEQVDRVDQAYVVYDVGYEAKAEKVRRWFVSKGIYLLGRFSYFEYVNVDMAVARAIKLAAELNGDRDDEATKMRYLSGALTILAESK